MGATAQLDGRTGGVRGRGDGSARAHGVRKRRVGECWKGRGRRESTEGNKIRALSEGAG